MCLLFESIRVENGMIPYLEYHQARLEKSAALSLESYISSIKLPQNGLFKLRITYSNYEFIKYSIEQYHQKEIKTLRLLEDNSIEYSVKSENREAINRAFSKRGECDDILIIKNGLITDTSYCNILFFDQNKWVTPSKPLLEGTHRARLIANKNIVPIDITPNDLIKFTKFRLINGVMDTIEGNISNIHTITKD